MTTAIGNSPWARTRGFTLLELMVVMGIVALAIVFVVPNLTAGAGVRMQAAARTVASALRQARDHAMTQGESAVVGLDLESKRLELANKRSTKALPSDVDFALYTAASETTSETFGGIRFFPDGSSTAGRIALSDGRSSILVDVDWLTGRVTLTEGNLADFEAGPSDERTPNR